MKSRAEFLCYDINAARGYRAGVMRIFLRATACILLFAATPSTAQNCAAIRTDCIDQCQGTSGATGQPPLVTGTIASPARVRACINRCFITPCQETPLTNRLCDATAQSICNNGFRACNNACVASTATTQAAIESQATCGTFCCTQLKRCLDSRQCDVGAIIVINCSENPGAAPVSGAP
jgi:hypothetical protein